MMAPQVMIGDAQRTQGWTSWRIVSQLDICGTGAKAPCHFKFDFTRPLRTALPRYRQRFLKLILSPLRGLFVRLAWHPRLAPWAAFFRRFAAGRFQSSLARGVGIDFDVGA